MQIREVTVAALVVLAIAGVAGCKSPPMIAGVAAAPTNAVSTAPSFPTFDSLPSLTAGACPVMDVSFDLQPQRGFQMVAQASRDTSGSYLESAIIVHAPPSWYKRGTPSYPSPIFDSLPRSRCGGARTVSIRHLRFYAGEREPGGTREVWFDTTAVQMGVNNVLLMNVDENGVGTVAGRVHVGPRLTRPSNAFRRSESAHAEATERAVWPLLRSSPEVRQFLKQR